MAKTVLASGPHTIREEQIRQASQRMYWKMKRIFDLLLSFALIGFCMPLLLLIAALVYMDDPHGSPIFCQTRIGLGGNPFIMYKFRTMTVDAEERREELMKLNEMDGPVFKIEQDPRVTRIGRFLRRSSLDELPQLFNVLLGDMSIIGPRPPLPGEVAEYTAYQWLRLSVKPGLTCNWQVRRDRNKLTFAEWIEEDMDYILCASFWTDLKLFFKTPFVMLRGEGC